MKAIITWPKTPSGQESAHSITENKAIEQLSQVAASFFFTWDLN